MSRRIVAVALVIGFAGPAGTWYVGTGNKWDKDATIGVKAGGAVTHFGKEVHYDGAKDEEVIVLITGEGPSTNTPVDVAP